MSIPILLLFAGIFYGCTDYFEELNKDKGSKYTDELTIIELQKLLLKPQYELYPNNPNMYQYGYNLHVDMFAGYMAAPHSFNENSNNTYKLRPEFNHGPLEMLLLKTIPNTQLVIKNAETKGLSHYIAMAKILQVISASYATDTYGPIPYRSVKSGREPYFYDNQEDVYNQLFEELESAVDILTEHLKQSPHANETDKLSEFDRICGGKYENWIKLANSIRLRLAMRIVKVKPQLARQVAEAAVNHEIGVFGPKDENIQNNESGIINPLWQICDWNDSRINASFESILKGYNYPGILKLIAPLSGEVIDQKGDSAQSFENDPYPYLHGIRMGISSVPGGKISANQYMKMSKAAISKDKALPIFNVAEIFFLKAEGILRGWNMGEGTVEDFYHEGIMVSLSKLDITNPEAIESYLEATSEGFPYKDLFDNRNNIPEGDPLLNNIPVKWDENDSNEKKLQKIITQKWIANFPLSFEAWADFRRTGYPKIFPVKINDSNGLIDTNIQIRRLPFTKQERDTNNDEVMKAEALLKGPDTGGTRLWWDIEKGNF